MMQVFFGKGVWGEPFLFSKKKGFPPKAFSHPVGFLVFGGADLLAGDGGELDFADSEVFGGDFHHFVVTDKLDGFFQRHGRHRGERNGLILAGCPHVAQLFGLAGVDVQVAVAVVLADDHAFVDLGGGGDEEAATGFQVVEGVGHGGSLAVRDQGAG